MKKSITLIGMAGAGKSTIGEMLAQAISYNFLDGDKIIEETINESIQSFIDQKGREEFTKLEESVLLSIQFNQTLLATGGSAVLCDAAMQFMKKESEVIFLDVSYENISQRITNLSERGLVRNPNQSLQEAYNERISLYKKYADHVVVNNGDIESCLKDLVTLTEEF
jgi:shikimate kinase|tara:strand:- start:31 stop:531 length:501 start_codon:yes stop_codon:yes gene_type:complete